jgi:SsrA-binding protein
MSLIHNKKASFEYETLEKLTAGIELFGFEVKAIRGKQGSLEGAYITVRGNEAFLIGVTIPPFQTNNTPAGYEPIRNRKLLLTAKEIGILAAMEKQKGLTIVPISMYNAGRKIKVDIAIVRGKKQFDKRETIKQRDTDREIRRTLKNQ